MVLKTILIISYSRLHTDPRILRQLQAISDDYKIITMGYTSPFTADNIKTTHYSINIAPKKRIAEKFETLLQLIKKDYQSYYKRLLDIDNILTQNINTPDGIIANDWNGLYLASVLKEKKNWRAKIYFDAHEYAPKEFDNSIRWRLIMQPLIIYALKICKKNIAIMSTVCKKIAKEYESFFNFTPGSVTIITNAPEYQDNLKPIFSCNQKIKLIHHGSAIKNRKIETMMKMMKYLNSEKYELTFMLVPNDKKYYNYLLKFSRRFKNIHFIDPVETFKISEELNKYDVGIFLLYPINFNCKYALPNKLFEYIQARIAIAIGPSEEMAKVINKYNLGVSSNDFSAKSFAKSIAALTSEQIYEYKKNADNCALELSAKNNIIALKKIITDLVG
jgi:hypothetical protein